MADSDDATSGARFQPSVPAPAATFLLIEATNDGYRLPDKGLAGEQARPSLLDTASQRRDETQTGDDDPAHARVRLRRRWLCRCT